MAKNSGASGGIGLASVLAIIFIVLKLVPDDHGHIIDWSWWWVLSPIWISWLLFLLVVGGIFTIIAIKGRK